MLTQGCHQLYWVAQLWPSKSLVPSWQKLAVSSIGQTLASSHRGHACRQNLEHCVQFWSPEFNKKMQTDRRRPQGGQDDQTAGECEERLKELGLFSLRKEMAQEEHHDSILALTRQLQRGQRLSMRSNTEKAQPKDLPYCFLSIPSNLSHQAST